MILLASSGVMEASIGSDGPSLMVVVGQFHSVHESKVGNAEGIPESAYLTHSTPQLGDVWSSFTRDRSLGIDLAMQHNEGENKMLISSEENSSRWG